MHAQVQTDSPGEVLFAGLVDDAGTFPPESLPLPDALRRHRRDRIRRDPMHSGRFLLGIGDLEALLRLLDPEERLTIALIGPPSAVLDAAVRTVIDDGRLTLAAVEHSLPAPTEAGLHAAIAATPSVQAPARRFVEIPTTPGSYDALLPVIVRTGSLAKIRCGGLRAELFPAPDALGRLIYDCIEQHVSFKATAGLHRAVRYRDPTTGFVHHGFLNLVVATARGICGAPQAEVVDALRLTEPAQLIAECRGLTMREVTRTRGALVSYGSCSTSEPVEELIAMGLRARR